MPTDQATPSLPGRDGTGQDRRYNERLNARATITQERTSSAAAAAAVVVAVVVVVAAVAAAAAAAGVATKHLLLSAGLYPSPLRRMLVPFLPQFSLVFSRCDDGRSCLDSGSTNDVDEDEDEG